MGQEAFVDVAYSGLEVGRRLKLRQVGPRTAYLEHGTPMPVGAEMLIRTDEGLAIPVVVIRVHEQVAGAELPPGMRIRALDLAGAAADWWRGLMSRDDPAIPEPEQPQPTLVAVPPPGPDLPLAEEPEAPEMPEVPEGPEGNDEEEITAGDTVVMSLAGPVRSEGAEEGGNGAASGEDRSGQTSSRTIVMSAAEISDITESAGESGTHDGDGVDDPDTEPHLPDAESDGEGQGAGENAAAPGSNGDEMRSERGRGRRRRRKR